MDGMNEETKPFAGTAEAENEEAVRDPAADAETALRERERLLDEREAALNLKERRERALGRLKEAGLPEKLLPLVDLKDDGTADETLKTLDSVFREAVACAVREMISREPPPAGAAPEDEGLKRVRLAMGLR